MIVTTMDVNENIKKNFSVKSVNVISHFWRSTVVIEKVIYYDKE